ncbi:MAG: nucleotidyltransferase family protein [Candidatus Limiplasma sp.]|nr:nucleotidyltransferase family protein [Candidatus Limiplasma sp.]
MKIGCVVMASGVSARFGGDKLLAPLWGKPLLAHLLDNLPETLARVVVVTRREAVASLAYERGLEVLLHDFPQVSDTIRLGLSSLGGVKGCMFCTGDQPGLTKASLQGLLDAFTAQPERIVRLCYGEEAGSPVIFPRSLFPELLALTPEQAGSAVIRRHRELLACVQASSPLELMDVDTREQLAFWEKRGPG